jgi:hypothetical protein
VSRENELGHYDFLGCLCDSDLYLMITNFERYWDSVEGKSCYTLSMMRDGPRPIECPPEYRDYSEGWYPVEGSLETQAAAFDSQIDPPFLSLLTSTSDWAEFEKYSSWLLKLLGIHNILVMYDLA